MRKPARGPRLSEPVAIGLEELFLDLTTAAGDEVIGRPLPAPEAGAVEATR